MSNPYEAFSNLKRNFLRTTNSEHFLLMERYERVQYHRGQDARALYSAMLEISHEMEQVGIETNHHMFRIKFLNPFPSECDVALAIMRDDSEIVKAKMLEILNERFQVISVREKRRRHDSKNPHA